MAHCSAMLCPQVTLSGDAEWPKVADTVIEARWNVAKPTTTTQENPQALRAYIQKNVAL